MLLLCLCCDEGIVFLAVLDVMIDLIAQGNSLPEAMRVNTNGWVRGSLNTDFEKFVENQKRFFRVSSSFDLRRASGGFQRSASYARVVDLGTTDGEFKNSSMGETFCSSCSCL